ncbi:OmpH family outer membrane protein [Chryseobacterium pennipullorum]|uniref:OmpH family outer membrane protein n=1 Tax=Chryseobacterium pennipullorum TaxID=2258963 RepID=A0A3D9B835_9FLAO|nr:OmpH family outer membrane protein [Chryseobacterium pennipullorum]REC49763.1 OmpH family outer membrane protein [Chryseobacterium pennipullorum]
MNLIKVLFITAGLTLSANAVNAQQKIGNVNTDDIFASLAEVKTITSTIDNLTKTRQGEVEKLIGEYQTKLKAAQEKEKTLNETNKEAVTKDLMAAQTDLEAIGKKIEAARAQAAKDISAKQTELFTPLQQKIHGAISAVAKEKGINYVFDTASQGANNLIYTDGSEDITSAVKTKLGASNTTAKPAAKSK